MNFKQGEAHMREYPILKSKLFLYLTEFFAGVSVMAVELGASRLLAPYFSSSQIVWTIIIGTILIAMALGNLYGGRAADKNPDPALLYRRILVAAVWIAAIPVLGKYVIMGLTALLIFTVSTNFLVIAAFASCMVIFVFPLFLLGTVTPSLVKSAVESLDDSGRTVGRLGACNTIGSILGTFLPTFVTIPTVGTSVTFLIFSGILLLIALAFFLSARKGLRTAVICVVLFALCLLFGRSTAFAFWEEDLNYEGESVYNYLQVKEDERSVVLSTNVLFGVQSVMMKDGGLTGMYYDYALAAPVMYGKEAPRVLILGNGTGTYARQCLNYFPGASVEGVEIDGRITDLALRYMHSDGEGSINQSLCDTIASVFPNVATADVRGNTNRELFACLEGDPAERLEQNLRTLESGELRGMMELVSKSLAPVTGGSHVLTDDRAPVEVLGMRAIDALISDELVWVRGIYEREGLSGLIASFS